MSSETLDFEALIEKIILYKDNQNQRYIDKFSKETILKLIEEEEKMDIIQSRLALYEPGGADILSFVRNLLDILPHSYDETLYLAMALIEIFRDVCERLNLNSNIRANDFSNYTVEKFLNRNVTVRGVFTKKLPKQKKFQEETTLIRDIDIQAPVVLGNTFKNIKRLIASKIKSDLARHENKGIKKACFGQEAKKTFILDDFSNYIYVVNLEGDLEKTLYAKGSQEKHDGIIVDLAWSSRQGRIGVTLNDFTLSFWDSIDNFEFEKSFSIMNKVAEPQTNIWYIEFLNMWITADKTSALSAWDILNEKKIFTLKLEKLNGTIIDIVQLEVMKLVLVATSDNKLSLVDLKKGIVLIQVDTASTIRSICWSATYQIFMTVGWENTIKLWAIDPKYHDITEIGKLSGHTGLVTAIGAIESTPMLVSTDDLGIVKIWDARSLECLQTIQFQLKSSIRQILDLYSHNKLGIVGHRVNFIEFDDADKSKQEKEQEELYPLAVEYNPNLEEFVVCSKKDVRIIDIANGRVKRIYEGLLTNEKDEITVFKMMQKTKKFIIGDDKGNLATYDSISGERILKLASHSNEITSLRLDHTNHLIVSGGWDSSVKIQKEGGDTYELKRSLINLDHHKAVSLIEISLFHSLLVTASNNHMLYVWDYEFNKLLAIVEGKEGSEFTYLQFINGYSTLIVADTTGKIHFLHLTRSDVFHVHAETLASIKIANEDEKTKACDFATRILINLEFKDYQEDFTLHKMYISTNKGQVMSYNLSAFFESGLVKMGIHAKLQASYNPERISHENFTTAMKGYVSPPFKIAPPQEKSRASIFSNLSRNIEQGLCEDFKAHNDALTTLSFLSISDRKLMTSSLDSHVKIWTLEGSLIASIKLNQPLPVMWNLKEEASAFKDKRKILCAIKLVESIFKKYSRDMTLREKANTSIKEFCESLSANTKKKTTTTNRGVIRNKPLLPILPLSLEPQKIKIMNDEYTPRDFNYESLKDLIKKDFTGPSLKEQDQLRRLMRIQGDEEQANEDRDNERFRKKAEREINKSESPKQTKANDRFIEFLIKDIPLFEYQELTESTQKLSAKLVKSVQPVKANMKPGEAILRNGQRGYENSLLNHQKSSSLKRLSYNHSPTGLSPSGREKKKLTIVVNDQNLSKNSQLNLEASSIRSIHSTQKISPTSKKAGMILDQSGFVKSNPIRGKIPSINKRPQGKSADRGNFYDYAAQKLHQNDETPSSASLLQNCSTTTATTNRTYNLERVQQRRDFRSIMHKLKTDVMKSQFIPRTHRNLEPIITDSLQTSRLVSERLHDRTPATTSNTPQESMNFLNELNTIKQETLDNWKLQMSEQERQDRYITELMVKNIKKPGVKPLIDNIPLKKIKPSLRSSRPDGLEHLFTEELGFKTDRSTRRIRFSLAGMDIGL